MSNDRLPDVEGDSTRSRRLAAPETGEPEAISRIGQILASKYRIEALLGSGGMAHVYRATNTVIGRIVAIKILRREHARSEQVVERFLREAKTANLIHHPNVIDVIDVSQDKDGSPFIVQEYLQGETFYQYACRYGGALPLPELIELIGPVLSAIAEAHSLGIVHRDIKPENVFLSAQRGRRVPKVLDFGISKVRGAEMTAVGTVLGTPAYMAPELAHSSKDADPCSDVWAIGVMLFELITGRLPFGGDTVAQIFLATATTDAARLVDVAPNVPIELSRVVERCLAREPANRYPDARTLAVDLASAFEKVKPGSAAGWSIAPPAAADGTVPLQPLEKIPHAPTLIVESKLVRPTPEAPEPVSADRRPSAPSPNVAGTNPDAAPARVANGPGPVHQTLPSASSLASAAPVESSSPSVSSEAGVPNRSSEKLPVAASTLPGIRRTSPTMSRSKSRKSKTPRAPAKPAKRQLKPTDALVIVGVACVIAALILLAFRLLR